MTTDSRRHALLTRWLAEAPTETNGRNMLLIGARGQVGLCCLDAWLKSGAKVVAVARKSPLAFTHPHLSWMTADLKQPETWPDITLPEVLVSCAPIPLLDPLMRYFAAHGVKRIVAFSSTSVHTKMDSRNAGDRALADQLRTAEQNLFTLGATYDIGVTILRPTLIYGIGLDKNVTSIARLLSHIPLFLLPMGRSGLRQPVHAMDLAEATVQAAEHPATMGQAYDVGGNEHLSYDAMVRRIAAQMARRIWIIKIPALASLFDLAGHILRMPKRINGGIAERMQRDMVFDDSAARRDFGWTPRNFLDSVRQPPHTPFF